MSTRFIGFDLERLSERQAIRLACVCAAVFVALHLVPDALIGRYLLGDASVRFGRLTRFSWTTYAALLLWAPLWLAAMRRMLRSPSRARYLPVLGHLGFWLLALVGVRYLGATLLWPGWQELLAGRAVGSWVVLGTDPLSSLLKSEAALISVAVLAFSDRSTLFSVRFIGQLLLILLVPPYLAAAALMLVLFTRVWMSLEGRWRLVVLAASGAIAFNEIARGTWPWGALVLSLLFFGWIRVVRAVEKAGRPSRPSPRRRREPVTAPPRRRKPAPAVRLSDRAAARRMLSGVVDAVAGPTLLVKRQAVRALGAVGDAGHLDRLTPLLDPEVEPSLRIAVIEMLGSIGGPAALDALRPVEHDPDPAVRWSARAALERGLTAVERSRPRGPAPPEEPPLVSVLE